MTHTLEQLWQRGCEFLGTETAILGGAMSWVSERNWVSAMSEAGAFGVIAASSMPPEILDAEIAATKELLRKGVESNRHCEEGASPTRQSPEEDRDHHAETDVSPRDDAPLPSFGVNLILMHPQLDELVAVCAKHKVSHVVLAGGFPKKSTIEAIHAFGGKVIAFAPTAVMGKKAIKMGADALIIEGNEAGGHIGPVSTSVLAQEILPIIKDVPVFVAGGIGRGEAIVEYLRMGASGVQMGTRFVCTKECIAHDNFKRAFIKANARDAGVSVQYHPDFPVIPVRAIGNKASEEYMAFQKETVEKFFAGERNKMDAQLDIEHYWAGALRKAVIDGDVEGGSLMAGQSVGMVKQEQTCREVVEELVRQAEGYLAS